MMYYLCFASATKGNVIPAERRLLFIAESKSEFEINLKLAKARPGGKGRLYERVTIRHDGDFHFETSTEE